MEIQILFDFFMHSVRIAVGAELFQLKASCGVPTIFHRGVTRYPCRSLIGIGATLGTLQSNHNSNALSHGFLLALSLN